VETESRIADFTELAATAVSNTQAWAETRRLAGEQSSLRRVATLVARAAPPPEVFAAVAEEVARLFGVDAARMWRFETDDEATVLAAWGELDIPARAGARLTPEPHSISARVRRTGAAARVTYDDPSDPRTADARAAGVQAAVGTPIVVDDRLWGAMVVATTHQEDLPADTEARVAEFTELIAMAISNLQARSELAASRARIAAATDEERRRVVRDLHDGAQQRLVQTVLTLKLAGRELAEASDQGPALVSEALAQAEQAMVELRELAHGILPAVLTRGGLRASVDVLISRMPMPVENRVIPDRLPGPIEATAYFVVAEALTNVTKHAHATSAAVTASAEDGALRVEVRDDGIGGARAEGHGLVGLADRLAALDGTLRIDSSGSQGTLVAAVIPLRGGASPT
jgi:signal transduction histidine kinase